MRTAAVRVCTLIGVVFNIPLATSWPHRATADAAGVPQSIASSQRYAVSGSGALALAKTRGFTFVSAPCTTSGDERSQALAVEATSRRPCRFRLFAGRSLNAGWALETVTHQCSHQGACVLHFTPGASLELSGALDVGAESRSGPSFVLIRVMILKGPAGADWRDAFRR